MNRIKIFLAAPISGFKDEYEYRRNRENLLNLITELRKYFCVYSEILNIGSLKSYDEPGESAKKDFNEISDADIFIIYHPMSMQSSTMIELGYAVAKEKKIIVIGEKDKLPYLALGLPQYSSKVKIISSSDLNEAVFQEVKMTIEEL